MADGEKKQENRKWRKTEGEIQRSDVAAMATGIARTKSSSTNLNPFMFNWCRQPGLATVQGEQSSYRLVHWPAAAMFN